MFNNLVEKLMIWWLDQKPFSRPWYQYFETPDGITNFRYVKDRGKRRTELMLDALRRLEFDPKDVVVDVGSNAGCFGIALSPHVARVYGVELDGKFHRQAEYLKALFSRYKNLDNHIPICGDINEYGQVIESANIALLSKVVYHENLGGKQESLLDKIFHKGMHTVVLQGHTTQGPLGEIAFMEELLSRYGFREIHRVEDAEYPILIGRRD